MLFHLLKFHSTKWKKCYILIPKTFIWQQPPHNISCNCTKIKRNFIPFLKTTTFLQLLLRFNGLTFHPQNICQLCFGIFRCSFAKIKCAEIGFKQVNKMFRNFLSVFMVEGRSGQPLQSSLIDWPPG